MVCEEGKRAIHDSEIPKYILKPANIQAHLQITWRIVILDSVVTKKQLLALATKNEGRRQQEREIVTIHFYPNGMNTDNVATSSVFYNKNLSLRIRLKWNPCEMELD